ncbi:MAG: ABC transporter ATP-binding protein, partial [Clostridia bacterium]|nr:ABC transporter ATP-binding protein [Clostridia bacterium]
EPKIVGGTLPAPEGPAEIRAEGLTFAYPGSDKAVLDGIDLTIAPGERVALVGYNGAGKTTLIKLLLRLYDPTEGRILLNGHDLREYDITSLREYFGCVFQDFVLFAATLGENVACDFMENSDPGKIREALDLAGFSERLAKMEKGIDTPLTREFDENGLNLSGGENQKVAMARTFAKPSGCIILDEPSAALDPLSEYRLNESMNAAAAGRTVVYISHRLSTTRMADRICMMEQGRIIESGSHDELMTQNGKYAEMFESQASRYVGEESA